MAQFTEVQRFTQKWIWGIVIVDGIFIWAFTFLTLTGRIANTSHLFSSITYLVFILCGLMIPILLFLSKLKTTVSPEGIGVHFFPFQSKARLLAFKDIRSIEPREYNPIGEYGGWGVRMGPQGRAYNVSGNKGIQIVLNNGDKILVGTQRSAEFMQAVQKAK